MTQSTQTLGQTTSELTNQIVDLTPGRHAQGQALRIKASPGTRYV